MATKKSFLLRMNPELHEIYESWAADELRSVNAHLEFVLRDAAVRAGRWPRAKGAKANDLGFEETAIDLEPNSDKS